MTHARRVRARCDTTTKATDGVDVRLDMHVPTSAGNPLVSVTTHTGHPLNARDVPLGTFLETFQCEEQELVPQRLIGNFWECGECHFFA